ARSPVECGLARSRWSRHGRTQLWSRGVARGSGRRARRRGLRVRTAELAGSGCEDLDRRKRRGAGHACGGREFGRDGRRSTRQAGVAGGLSFVARGACRKWGAAREALLFELGFGIFARLRWSRAAVCPAAAVEPKRARAPSFRTEPACEELLP